MLVRNLDFLSIPKEFSKVEVNKYFGDIENRTLLLDESKTVNHTVENFKL